MRNSHGRTRNMAGNTEKRAKLDTYTVGIGIWQKKEETLKILENEECTLYDLEYGK